MEQHTIVVVKEMSKNIMKKDVEDNVENSEIHYIRLRFETNVINNKENNIEWNVEHSVNENNKVNIVNNNIKYKRITKYNIRTFEN